MLRSLATAVLLTLVLGSGCTGSLQTAPTTAIPASTPSIPSEPPPSAMREFRGAWIATVANIDWPSEAGLDTGTQQAELRHMLDQAAALGLNAVVFQVRPMADALYRSDLEPWSSYLTGQQGGDPGYDPLAFAIEEAHGRGMELHAWFNPFRAGHPTTEGAYDSLHVQVSQPDWVVEYGNLHWMDPGIPEARDHSLAVMMDVVRRYDVDGIHLDDYFYPYPANDSLGQAIPFPDDPSWQASGYEGDRADWRRDNVNRFVSDLYGTVKAERPEVKVGISPFGIWRPGHPEGIEGFDQYEGLYADARLWLQQGWVDYFTPQLYWALDSSGQPYGPLLDWWNEQNVLDRHLWPGNYASRIILEGSAYWEPEELLRQVRHTRNTPESDGNIHFSMKALMPGVGAHVLLRDSVYAEPALTPVTTWLGGTTPAVPRVAWEGMQLRISPREGEQPPRVWHLREWDGSRWQVRLIPGIERAVSYTDAPVIAVVSAVSALGIESPNAWALRRQAVE
ncbi:MAG: family 10 glycosylhydrolase [Rhodothermales bacterium]|nr:family 10 glycosylhydrolase [Rhodothermales bacterium]